MSQGAFLAFAQKPEETDIWEEKEAWQQVMMLHQTPAKINMQEGKRAARKTI